MNLFRSNRFVKTGYRLGIGIGLITGMSYITISTSRESLHDIRTRSGFTRFPLFEFDDNHVLLILRILTGNKEVDAFCCQRYLIFDSYIAIIRDLRIIQHVAHVLHGVGPTAVLCIVIMRNTMLEEGILYLLRDQVIPHILRKPTFRIAINDHIFVFFLLFLGNFF